MTFVERVTFSMSTSEDANDIGEALSFKEKKNELLNNIVQVNLLTYAHLKSMCLKQANFFVTT